MDNKYKTQGLTQCLHSIMSAVVIVVNPVSLI